MPEVLVDPHDTALEWCCLDGVLHWRYTAGSNNWWSHVFPDFKHTFEREVLWAVLRA